MTVFCRAEDCVHNEDGECHYTNPCGGMDFISIDYRDGYFAPPVCTDYKEKQEEKTQ